jgi:hypothetical protein
MNAVLWGRERMIGYTSYIIQEQSRIGGAVHDVEIELRRAGVD